MTYALILTFLFSTGISSEYIKDFDTKQACEDAALMTATAPSNPSNLPTVVGFCVPVPNDQ